MTAYNVLKSRFRRLHQLEHAMAILTWDEATFMPNGGATARANAKAELSIISHEILTQEDMAELLASAQAKSESLNEWERQNLTLMEKLWKQNSCLPVELVERASQSSSRCEMAWREQRQNSDWKAHLPLLKEVLECQKEVAAIKASAFNLSAYDALLEQFEPGLRSEKVSELFAAIQKEVPDILEIALEKQKQTDILSPTDSVAIEKQESLGKFLMKSLGFDFSFGRLDVSHHPFCGGVSDDVRLTTRYSEMDFISSLMGILHETGHALYEQNLPADWRDQPVGRALGIGIHESQSLFIEMQICRSRGFLNFLRPLLIEYFELDSGDPTWSIDNLHRFYNRVRPGYIRVDADELTYPLHIGMRFEIEKELIEGKLKLEDLPERWDADMQKYLGLKTGSNHRDACMQDIHWPAGLFGYFPCYSIGAMIAAQWKERVDQSFPNLEEDLAKGRLQIIKDWLVENIHSKASRHLAPQLIKEVSGKELAPTAFLKHLRKRYT